MYSRAPLLSYNACFLTWWAPPSPFFCSALPRQPPSRRRQPRSRGSRRQPSRGRRRRGRGNQRQAASRSRGPRRSRALLPSRPPHPRSSSRRQQQAAAGPSPSPSPAPLLHRQNPQQQRALQRRRRRRRRRLPSPVRQPHMAASGRQRLGHPWASRPAQQQRVRLALVPHGCRPAAPLPQPQRRRAASQKERE